MFLIKSSTYETDDTCSLSVFTVSFLEYLSDAHNITMDFDGDNSEIREEVSVDRIEFRPCAPGEVSDTIIDVFEYLSPDVSIESFLFNQANCGTAGLAPSFSEKEDYESVCSTSTVSSCTQIPSSPTLTNRSSVEPITSPLIDSSVSLFMIEQPMKCTSRHSKPMFAHSPRIKSTDASSPLLVNAEQNSFLSLRITYLLVTLVIMLADGLQGVLRLVYSRL